MESICILFWNTRRLGWGLVAVDARIEHVKSRSIDFVLTKTLAFESM